MTLIKQNLVPTLLILAASALVVLVSLPLAQTDWADGFRTGFDSEETTQVVQAEATDGEEETLPGGVASVAPFFKVIALMGIGGLFTALVSGIIKFVSRRKTS